jgi:hypothetical protein
MASAEARRRGNWAWGVVRSHEELDEADLAFWQKTGAERRSAALTELNKDLWLLRHASFGIPEPHLVSDADGTWRSRMRGDRWEVNDEHEDYRALRGEPRARVRYVLTLLAKEIVLRTSGRPDGEALLEQVVEVLAHAERNLRGG